MNHVTDQEIKCLNDHAASGLGFSLSPDQVRRLLMDRYDAAHNETLLAAATKRAEDAERERDAITAERDLLRKLNGDLRKVNDHVIAAHESLRLELGLEIRESFEDAVRAVVSKRDAALAVLRDVEYKGIDNIDECCPSCNYVGTHAPDCALAACLKGDSQ